MDRSKVDGARQQERTFFHRESKDKTCICPVQYCDNRTFLARGAAENMWTLSNEKLSESLIEKGIMQQQSNYGAAKFGDGLKKRAGTTKRPYYSISSGIRKKVH